MGLQVDKYSNYFCAKAEDSELEKIRNFVNQKAIEFGFDESVSAKIVLAVDEACSNLIKHSYRYDSQKEICLLVSFSGKEFVVDILDDGKIFNPLQVPSPDMKKYFDEYKRGGLGIHIIKLIMDEISYLPNSGEPPKNILRLKKYLS